MGTSGGVWDAKDLIAALPVWFPPGIFAAPPPPYFLSICIMSHQIKAKRLHFQECPYFPKIPALYENVHTFPKCPHFLKKSLQFPQKIPPKQSSTIIEISLVNKRSLTNHLGSHGGPSVEFQMSHRSQHNWDSYLLQTGLPVESFCLLKTKTFDRRKFNVCEKTCSYAMHCG